MIILGLSGADTGDAAAALLVDQTLVAVAEEAPLAHTGSVAERLPWAAARYCLEQAGLRPDQVDQVAIATSPPSLSDPLRWQTALRLWEASPVQALLAPWQSLRRDRHAHRQFGQLLTQLGYDLTRIQRISVNRLLAQVSGACSLSGLHQPTAFLCFDSGNDPAALLLGTAHHGRIHISVRQAQPDSLNIVMQCMGAYLGFDAAHAMEGIALLARHGDPHRYDLSKLFSLNNGVIRINTHLFAASSRQAWQHQGKHYPFSKKLVDWLGPPCIGTQAPDPYLHYAAALQHLFEKTMTSLIEHHLGDTLKRDGTLLPSTLLPKTLLLCGDAATNRQLNRQLATHSHIRQLYAAPFTGSAGAALGAASWAAAQLGILLDPVQHTHWGPMFSAEECISACKKHSSQPLFEMIKDPAKKAARLLAEGHSVGWFQGRMEAGRLPLGTRAQLFAPTSPQRQPIVSLTATGWSAASLPVLSMTATKAAHYSDAASISPFADRYVPLNAEGLRWLPDDLQLQGAAALQSVNKKHTPALHALLEELERITGHGMVLQLPLKQLDAFKQPGESVVCTPKDALDWFAASPVNYLVMETLLIKKS